jgi:probable rRNA maturation factor
MTPLSTIHFSNADTTVSLRDRNALKIVLGKLFQHEKKRLISLQYVFCSDQYLLRLNKDFLQHDHYTDILTFEMSAIAARGVEGEIYISIDRVRENARHWKVSLRHELTRVILHGALHLCGHQDSTPQQQQAMRLREEQYLSMLF